MDFLHTPDDPVVQPLRRESIASEPPFDGVASPSYYGSISPTRELPASVINAGKRGRSEPPARTSLDDVCLANSVRIVQRARARRRVLDARWTPSGRPVRVRGVAYTFIRDIRPAKRDRKKDSKQLSRVRSASCDVLAVDSSDEFVRSLTDAKESDEASSEFGGIKSLCSDWKRASVLMSIAIVDFTSYLCLSIMAPFFPAEAGARGVSPALSGMIFSSYALVCFMVSPTMGKMIPRIGLKFMFVSGTFVSGACCVLFGFLDRIEGKMEFVAFCLLVRCMEAVGAAAFSAAAFPLVAELFPDNIGAVMGTLETFVGLGLSVGPAIGGALYDLDGYYLPFLVLGSMMLLSVPLNMALLPPDKRETAEAVRQNAANRKSGMLEFLRQPRIGMICVAVTVLSADWSYLDPTLQPHLEQFQLTANQLGLFFLLSSVTYAISSPIWGFVSDRWINGWTLVSSGLVVLGTILIFLGPSPWIPYLPDTLWSNVLCLGLMGTAIAWGLVPTFQLVLDAASDAGYKENISTYGLVSGVWTSLYSLGEVLGPALGGLLMDNFGFGVTSTLFGITTIAVGIIIGCFATFCVNDRDDTVDGDTTVYAESRGTDSFEREENDLQNETSKVYSGPYTFDRSSNGSSGYPRTTLDTVSCSA
ncbi:unnamed protein product [Notodromas monacha]|uniref:Major facilitator superfamily (MFS) profile domain-containing protein n=1 Tax=Notodromas monacha TaxID=399045 RepID=A0A7R9BKS8_9CRUS|nr:unnamed protein product [Notodromas monacha]CAG0916519.1 unnamed protein product [Notodromas monacha]